MGASPASSGHSWLVSTEHLPTVGRNPGKSSRGFGNRDCDRDERVG